MSRSRFSKLVSVVITGVIAISGLPSMVLADMINSPTYYSVQSELDYEITTNITSSWINHESIDLVLTNTGSDTIHNWYLTFDTPYNIENIWNGSIYETDGTGTYTITSNGWNQDIRTGESVTVGITFSSDTETELSINPEWYLLNTQATVVDASLYTLDYTEYSSWESGFTGQLTLQPHVDCQHWSLTFTSNRDITAVSSAVLNTEDDGSYEITHDENNMSLLANNAYNFGIQGVNSEDSLEFIGAELTVADLAFHLTDDIDANGIADYLDFMGGGIVVELTPTPTDVPTVSPTEEPTETPMPTDEPIPALVVDPYSNLEDRDEDGLLDYLENMYMTDPDNPDTDGDGLLDGDEINILTNPRVVDTDGNGISDFEEDFDGDGIHNGGEYATGTCMFACDSDYDGVNDYNEVYFYGIDPRNEDSDSDAIKDGDEVTLGLNPGSSDSDGDGITDNYVLFSQSLSMASIADDHPHEILSVQISGSISGLITSNTKIEDMYNRDVYCTDVCGRVGIPINIESEGYFESMTLSIVYDENALGETNENDLGVLWYDEESGFFILQEQAVVDTTNNTITLALNHFSTYILVDLNKWNNLQITTTTSTTGSIRTVTWHTRGVYYDAFPIYEQNEAGEWIDTGRFYGGTIAPERYENTAWNQYLASHPNDVRLETLNIGHFIVFGGLNYTYTWSVYTNESTDGDNDQDGLPDNLEISGILGTNGEVYYSDPNSIDSDEDTLTDGEEIGNLYLLHRDENGALTISLNNTVIYESEDGSISPDSTYYYFHRYSMLLGCGQYIGIACIKSNPNEQYSDEDSARDDEDARPQIANEDMWYMIANTSLYDYALFNCEQYKRAGVLICLLKFSDYDSFSRDWNGLGLYNSYYLDGSMPYGNKYYYNVTNVGIHAHGTPVSIDLGGRFCKDRTQVLLSCSYIEMNGYNVDEFHTADDLDDKKIESLVFFACSTGASVYNCRNLACDFLDNQINIQRVVAPDCILTIMNNHFVYLGFYSASIYVYSDDDDNPNNESEYYYSLRACIEDNSYAGRGYIVEGVIDRENANGFTVFPNNEESNSYDLFPDDVYYGSLHVLGDNWVNDEEGILLYDTNEAQRLDDYILGDSYIDPMLVF